jgi:hypothetical protein
LVLNLVSSTLPCIRQPRPRLRVLDVCGSVQVYTQALTGFWPLNSWLILLPLTLWLSIAGERGTRRSEEARMSEKAVRRKSGGASPGRWEWAKDGDRGARVKCGRVRADRKGARRSERRPFTSPRLLRSFSYHPPSRGPISSNRPPRLDLYYVHLQ